MPTTHPNLRKMTAAVSGWIEAAKGRMDGATALNKRVAWMDDQIALLGREDLTTPAYLVGLTVWDLMGAQDTLRKAAKAQAERVAGIAVQAQRVAA